MPKTTWSFLAGMLLSCLTASVVLADDSPSPTINAKLVPRPLTLPVALAHVFAANPGLAATRAAVTAAEASARQAGSFVNPQLSLDVENFSGDDSLRGFDGAETTLRLDQTIELGGKRSQRQALGIAAAQVAAQQHNLAHAELYARTVEVFMTLLAAQQHLQLAETQLLLATQTCDSIQAQITAGKTSAIAGVRSQPLLIEARLERDRAASELTKSQQDLAELLDDHDAASLIVQGELGGLPEIPQDKTPEASAATLPLLALAAATRDQVTQELAVAKLQAIPDVTLGLGVRRFEENGERALVAGISVPLPLFDRNRHGIAAATARLEQARSAERSAELATRAALAQARQELRTRRAEVRALQDELLPAAQQSFEAVDYGYRSGKFSLLDLLDTQRQLSEVQTRLLAAQVDCHVAAARLDGLLGRFPLAIAE